MKSILSSAVIAFSMYSRLPMPKTEWNERSMKYLLCFLPLVGAAEGIIYIAAWKLMLLLEIPKLPAGALLTALPVMYTGGIHMDGFLDTVDAKCSNQSREKKLEILKDSRSGAFAVMYGAVYLILYFAFATELQSFKQVLFMGTGFCIIRAYSAMSLVFFKNARGSGIAMKFSEAADLNVNRLCLIIWVLAGYTALFLIEARVGLLLMAVSFISFLHYRVSSYDEFGGITGDLAGYFLQLSELLMLICITLTGRGA